MTLFTSRGGVASCGLFQKDLLGNRAEFRGGGVSQRMGEGRVNQNCRAGARVCLFGSLGVMKGHGEHEDSLLQGRELR